MKKLQDKDIYQTSIKEKMAFKSIFLPSDILIVAISAIICIIFVVTPSLKETAGPVILSLFFVLFLPGYSIMSTLFPKKCDIDGIERVALSFGLSVVFTPIIGLILNYTLHGIDLAVILLSLSVFTVLMNSIAYIRRLKVPSNDRFTVKPTFKGIFRLLKLESRVDKFLSIVLIISIILAVSMTVYATVTPKQGEKFTEFYILGSDGKASNYPTNLTIGENGNVLIGIVNHENAKTDYHMVVQLNGKTIKEENITLSNNEKWENKFSFRSYRKGENRKLVFSLYKLPDNSNVYRSLHLWVNIN